MIARTYKKCQLHQKKIDALFVKMKDHRAQYMSERAQMQTQIDCLIQTRKQTEREFLANISKRFNQGETISSIARKLKVSPPTVSNWISKTP
jgi:DNA-binding NarL/FixJ family response regulator